MAAITKAEKAQLYLNLIKDSLSESDVEKMWRMTRQQRIDYIIDRFKSMKLDEIRQLRAKLKAEHRKYERSVIKERIIEVMGELHGKRDPSKPNTLSTKVGTGNITRGIHFR